MSCEACGSLVAEERGNYFIVGQGLRRNNDHEVGVRGGGKPHVKRGVVLLSTGDARGADAARV